MININKINSSLGLFLASSTLMISGCASQATPTKLENVRNDFYDRNNIPQPRTEGVIVHNDVPYVDTTPIQYREGSENLVDVRATGSSLVDALSVPANAIGYSVSFTEDVDPRTSVNMQLRNIGAIEAMKKLAMASGYVAVVDSRNNNVTVTREATWVYKIPKSIFDSVTASYDVGMTTDEAETDDSGGGSQTTSSSFTVSGESASDELDTLIENVQKIVANSSEDFSSSNVTFSSSTGTMTVTGDVFALNRVKTLLEQLVKDALTQVEVKTIIAQVRLNDSQRYGINWRDILAGSSSSVTEAALGGGLNGLSGDNSNFNAVITKKDATTVVRALAQQNQVSVMASPSIIAKNNTPATIFNGSKVPYLGRVESTLSSGTTSVSAEAQYASDGLNLSIIPHALNNRTVSIKLIPSLTDVGDFRTFAFGNSEDGGGVRLEVPETFQRQMFIDVTAETGETVILGGTRTSSRDRGREGVPGLINSNNFISRLFGGVDNSDSEEELVIILTTNIIPAPQYDPLVSESI